MTTEATLFDLQPLTEPDYTPGLSLQERFDLWVAANPAVVELAEQLTREWLAAGRTRLGIGALTEQMRWQSGIRTVGEPWKLNNSYRSRLVRRLIERNPSWSEVFATRQLKAA